MLTRRALLAVPGLLLGPSALATRLRLGWRLSPGMELTWDTRLQRVVAGVTTRRRERWRYTVRRVDQRDIATLEGRLVGLGLEGSDGWGPEAAAATPTELVLGMSGALITCSEPVFARALPHRLLALGLPDGPVAMGEVWHDLATARAFARLLPVSLGIRVSGTATLDGVDDDGRVTISTHGGVQSDGPAIDLVGWARWDAARGVLLHRELTATLKPSEPSAEPGRLDLLQHLVI